MLCLRLSTMQIKKIGYVIFCNYFLPPNLIVKCPTLNQLPRDFSELSASADMMGLIESDTFFR